MTMENIASFNIDHLRLKRGIYVSRIDRFDAAVITTFDIRMKEPNNEPVIDIPALHTLEHLGAAQDSMPCFQALLPALTLSR
jgi:S-ribosylhomocysteine lyase